MLVISGLKPPLFFAFEDSRFNLAIEMLVISGRASARVKPSLRIVCFNLAIEMLVISGRRVIVSMRRHSRAFQSRNRDACHFRAAGSCKVKAATLRCFNLAIEMLVISGSMAVWIAAVSSADVSISQSRCLSFQGQYRRLSDAAESRFQSRNRDACHFRSLMVITNPLQIRLCFNLAIEMLVISGTITSAG